VDPRPPGPTAGPPSHPGPKIRGQKPARRPPAAAIRPHEKSGLVLQQRLEISGSAGVVRFPGGGLAVAPPALPVLVECVRAAGPGVEVEQAAGLDGGERDQFASGFVFDEGWRGVCPGRPASPFASAKQSSIPQRAPATATSSGRVTGRGDQQWKKASSSWPFSPDYAATPHQVTTRRCSTSRVGG
jgi:hypothetical protein